LTDKAYIFLIHTLPRFCMKIDGVEVCVI